MEARHVGMLLLGLGLLLGLAGVAIWAGWSLPSGLRPGSLPGDFSFRRGNSSVTLLLGTSMLLSVVLTLILAFFRK